MNILMLESITSVGYVSGYSTVVIPTEDPFNPTSPKIVRSQQDMSNTPRHIFAAAIYVKSLNITVLSDFRGFNQLLCSAEHSERISVQLLRLIYN